VLVLGRGDPSYPAELHALGRPPERLWVQGTLPLGRAVAVVGTRAPDREGRRFARELGEALAGAGVVVVSGCALGIDAAAHEGALEAGGETIAILGTGVDVVYPAVHRALQERIAARGALVSELSPGTPPRREHFPQRNRIVAALSSATIVVQAGPRSGALSTAAIARRLGRPVVAVPWSPYEPRGEGTAALLRKGAAFAGSVADVLVVVGCAPNARTIAAGPPAPPADPADAAIVAALSEGPLYLTEIVDETGLPASVAARKLFSLVQSGRVEETDFQRFGLVRSPRS
jgi:DNA processing protein